MQYLAKVHAKASMASSQLPSAPSSAQSPALPVGSSQLQLLAVNTAEQTWELVAPPRMITVSHPVSANEQVLVLVNLDADEKVITVKDATAWVLNFVSEYLTLGITSKDLAEELERAEQWRQSLTLQSQEVRRRALETAARRDEIQDLEKRLKLEREMLESNINKADQ